MMNIKNVMNDQNGFTLLDSIFSMLILSLIMSLMPLIFHSFAAIDRTIKVDEDYEWNLFLIQLRNELEDANMVLVDSNRIIIDKKVGGVFYETYGYSIRRTVNDKGHEVVLQHVPSVLFSQHGQMLRLNVVFANGVKEEARFIIPLDKGEEEGLEMNMEPLTQLY